MSTRSYLDNPKEDSGRSGEQLDRSWKMCKGGSGKFDVRQAILAFFPWLVGWIVKITVAFGQYHLQLLRYAITKPLLGLGFSFIMFLSLSIGYIGYNPKPSNVIAIVDDKGNPLGPYLPVKDIVALEHLHLAAMHGAQNMPTVHVPKRVKIKIVRRKRTRRSHRSPPITKKPS